MVTSPSFSPGHDSCFIFSIVRDNTNCCPQAPPTQVINPITTKKYLIAFISLNFNQFNITFTLPKAKLPYCQSAIWCFCHFDFNFHWTLCYVYVIHKKKLQKIIFACYSQFKRNKGFYFVHYEAIANILSIGRKPPRKIKRKNRYNIFIINNFVRRFSQIFADFFKHWLRGLKLTKTDMI